MKTGILLLNFLLLVGSFSLAQSNLSVRKKNITKSEVKQIEYKEGKALVSRWSVDEYDKKGRLVSEKEYYSDSTYKLFDTYTYDSKGQIIQHIEFDKSGQLKRKTETDFDNLNDRKEERVYNAKNELTEVTVFQYNSFGQKTEEATYSADRSSLLKKVIYAYDSKGSLIERRVMNAAGELIQLRNYTITYNQ